MGKGLNSHFSKKDTEIANKYMKIYSTALIIREMHIISIMEYNFTATKIAINVKKKAKKRIGGVEDVDKLKLFIHCWWECKIVQSLWKKLAIPQKIKLGLPYDPAVPLFGIYSK